MSTAVRAGIVAVAFAGLITVGVVTTPAIIDAANDGNASAEVSRMQEQAGYAHETSGSYGNPSTTPLREVTAPFEAGNDTAWCGVVQSDSGTYYAMTESSAQPGTGDTIIDAALDAGCDSAILPAGARD